MTIRYERKCGRPNDTRRRYIRTDAQRKDIKRSAKLLVVRRTRSVGTPRAKDLVILANDFFSS